MKGTIAIIKTDGSIHFTYHTTAPTLEQLQAGVGGYIELVPMFDTFGGQSCTAYCNENGKIDNLPYNEVATDAWRAAVGQEIGDALYGDVVIVSGDNEFMESQ